MSEEPKKEKRADLWKARILVSIVEELSSLGLMKLAEQKEELAVMTVGTACFSTLESRTVQQ